MSNFNFQDNMRIVVVKNTPTESWERDFTYFGEERRYPLGRIGILRNMHSASRKEWIVNWDEHILEVGGDLIKEWMIIPFISDWAISFDQRVYYVSNRFGTSISNPPYNMHCKIQGTIINIRPSFDEIRANIKVKWDNGYKNYYRWLDLLPVSFFSDEKKGQENIKKYLENKYSKLYSTRS